MLTNIHIVRIIREAALKMNHDLNVHDLQSVEVNKRSYDLEEWSEFKRDLIEAANKVKLLLMEFTQPPSELSRFIKSEQCLAIAIKKEGHILSPVLLDYANLKTAIIIEENDNLEEPLSDEVLQSLVTENGEVFFLVITPYQNLASEYGYGHYQEGEKLSPIVRFFRLLKTEKKDIFYIAFYAIVIGLISLILPLGIQATVELISGGVFFSSIYLLIGLVVLGIVFSGGLQLIQISLVEYLQRRIFAKAALEFAFRIPRIKIESLFGNYAPELVNRFFDVITIQKGLPKLLIDLSSGVVQIFFGLFLLSLYHPFFIFFSIILLLTLFIIFYLTGPKGLQTAINESKYKYKVAQWLEELARALNSFKLAGNTDLPTKKTDNHISSYLKYRKSHFKILLGQFSSIIVFKALITGGLLIMGTILVVNRQITLGQFVAAEVIIILILNSVEKIITYMDVVYDLITAIDKVSHVTDLSLDKIGGIDLPAKSFEKGYSIQVKDVSYQYPHSTQPILKNLSFEIKSGEHVCISGPGGSGKTTLTNILVGLQTNFNGIVTINNYSIRDLDLTHLRDKIAKNISHDDIFDGTLLENITIGKSIESPQDVIDAMRHAGVDEKINQLPEGLNTHIVSGGKGFSSSFINRLILARCFAKNPALIVLNDFFNQMNKSDKLDLINRITDKSTPCTIVAVSNDPIIMAACDRVLVLEEGRLVADDTFASLMKDGLINRYLD
jgi:ABC-type bacteriocin/lantibiotic exporter with double-glycine peptidase domain